MEQQIPRVHRVFTEPRFDKGGNELPHELVLNLLAHGYPLEELLEFFPMFTLDQLMLLLDDVIIH